MEKIDLALFIRRKTDTQGTRAFDILDHLAEKNIKQIPLADVLKAAKTKEGVLKNLARRSQGGLEIDNAGIIHIRGRHIHLTPRGGWETSTDGSGLRGQPAESNAKGFNAKSVRQNNGQK